jgi:hypothetical protein
LKTKAKKKGDCNSVLWGSWISHASLKRSTKQIENESKNKKGIKSTQHIGSRNWTNTTHNPIELIQETFSLPSYITNQKYFYKTPQKRIYRESKHKKEDI